MLETAVKILKEYSNSDTSVGVGIIDDSRISIYCYNSRLVQRIVDKHNLKIVSITSGYPAAIAICKSNNKGDETT